MFKGFWAITAEALDFIMAAFKKDAAQPSIDTRVANKIELQIRDGVAIVPVMGALNKDHGLTSYWSASGYKGIREQVEVALANGNVSAILLRIDSPGGSVDGCKELADFLSTAGQEKPIYAYADGQATSAAYWIASTAKHIAAPETAVLGSIGVRTLHADWSAWNDKAGIKYTHITAGDFKAAGNGDAPLDDESLNYIQSQLASLWNIFTRDVAQNRNLDQQAVTNQQAKVYLAEEAKTFGLIDAITPDIDTYINWITSAEGIRMDKIELKTKHPALFDEISRDAKAAADADVDAKTKAAAENLLGLIGAVADADTSAKIIALHSAGISATQAAAMKAIFGAAAPTPVTAPDMDAESRKVMLDAIKTATPGVVSGDPASTVPADFDSLVKSEMASGKSKVDAMKAVQKAHPALHEKWILDQQEAK